MYIYIIYIAYFGHNNAQFPFPTPSGLLQHISLPFHAMTFLLLIIQSSVSVDCMFMDVAIHWGRGNLPVGPAIKEGDSPPHFSSSQLPRAFPQAMEL